MQVLQFRHTVKCGESLIRFIASDLHLGAGACDEKKLKADLDFAKSINARIRINGDVFDCVPSSKGDPRSAPGVSIKSLWGQPAMTDKVISYATDFFAPYAENIDWLGIGNHEESVIRYCFTDPVGRVIEKLNTKLATDGKTHRIQHGGIAGFEQTTLEVRSARMQQRPLEEQDGANVRHIMFYHHGAGGDAQVTKGLIGVNRASVGFDFDSMTEGHRHNKVIIDDVVLKLTPSGQVVSSPRLTMLTGSYLKNYTPTTQENPLAYTYSESKRYAPKPMGGIFHILTTKNEERKKNGKRTTVLTVDQTAHSDLRAFERHMNTAAAYA